VEIWYRLSLLQNLAPVRTRPLGFGVGSAQKFFMWAYLVLLSNFED